MDIVALGMLRHGNMIKTLAVVGLGLAIALELRVAAGPPSSVQLVSAADPVVGMMDSSGGQCFVSGLSADGRFVTFVSDAFRLAGEDRNGKGLDVFVRDRQRGVTSRVSARSESGVGGDGPASWAVLSADGSSVAFQSEALDLVTNTVVAPGNVFVRSLATGLTRLLSVSTNGTGGNRPSVWPVITPDARFVAFESDASDLVPNDQNGGRDVFLADLETGTLRLVSVDYLHARSATGRASEDPFSSDPDLSADGRYAAFTSRAVNLVNVKPSSSGASTYTQVYVADLHANAIELVSTSTNQAYGNGDSDEFEFSADGRYLAFRSTARNLVNEPSPARTSVSRIFWRDLDAGRTLLVSTNALSVTAVGTPVFEFALSADGQHVAFVQDGQIQVWDAATGRRTLASLNNEGEAANGDCSDPILDPAGMKLLFLSSAANLSDSLTGETAQVYLRDLAAGTTTRISTSWPQSSAVPAHCFAPVWAPATGVIAFNAGDGNLTADDVNQAVDGFVRDLAMAHPTLISGITPPLGTAAGNGSSWLGPGNAMSADGRYVAFGSLASDLAPGDTNRTYDVFVRDLWRQTNLVASSSQTGGTGNAASVSPVLTPDGRYVAFVSTASDLVADDTNWVADVFVRDLVLGATTLASVDTNGAPAGSPVTLPRLALSDDGRFVAFTRQARSPASPEDLFVRDLAEASSVLIRSVPLGRMSGFEHLTLRPGPQLFYVYEETLYAHRLAAGGPSQALGPATVAPSITADGRFVILEELRDGTAGTIHTISRLDIAGGSTQRLATTTSNHRRAAASSYSRSAVSADGRWIAFVDGSSELSPLDGNSAPDVYIADATQPPVFVLASVNRTGTASGNGPSGGPTLSADGQFVAFRSAASDLVEDDGNAQPDIFIRDLQLGITWLVSRNVVAPGAGDARSGDFRLSANGQILCFESFASNLVAADRNPAGDVFVCLLALPPRIAIQVSGHPAQVRLSFPAPQAAGYRIEYRDSLTELPWEPLPGATSLGEGDELNLTDPSVSPTGRRFYRLRAN